MPEGWAWCRLGYICSLHDGEKIEKQLQYLDAKHFRGKGTTICNSGKYVAENSYLILVDGENSGEVFYTETAGFQGSTFKILNITNIIFNKYALYLIRKEQELLRNSKVGSAIPHLNKQLFKELLIPIPSFLEQKRLVSTIENAFNTIDELENNKIELSNVISKAKSKILDLAIHGKLVPQDTNDEPASILLEKLRSEKEEKIAKGELKRDKNDSYIYKGSDNCYYQRFANGCEEDLSDEIPYELPESWTWCTLGEIYNHTTGKALKKTNNKGTLRKYITTSNLYWNSFDFSEVRSMYFTDDELEKCTIKKGDLVLCNGGDVGRAAIWNYDYDICYQNHVSRLRPKAKNINNSFFMYVIMIYKKKGMLNGKGVGITSLSANDLLSAVIPLLPYSEQKHIVSKIEELFSYLDTISSNLE